MRGLTVQEPDGLVLVGERAQVLELLMVVSSVEHGRVVGRHLFFRSLQAYKGTDGAEGVRKQHSRK